MLSNPRQGLSNSRLCRTRNRMIGNSFRRLKPKQKRFVKYGIYMALCSLGGILRRVLVVQVGFFTGRKKESIFKSPEDPFGKVGVTGSGKGLTDFQKREKHLHLKSGNAEGTDE